MDPKFSYIASSLTDAELTERVTNRKIYMPDTVEASLTELLHRKHQFSEEEINRINEDVRIQRAIAATVDSRRGFFNSNAKKVIVKDAEAPLMYSRQAIYGFTFLCGALFGSIMMAINVGKTENHSKAIWIVMFGIGFTALQIFIFQSLATQNSSSYAYLGGLIAAAIIDGFFWKKYIGYATFYRARPIWIPLIIALVFLGLLITLIVIGNNAA